MKRVPKRIVPGLPERLLELREAAELSQQVLATRAGISIPTLSAAERFGVATTKTIGLLARALGTDVDRLMGRSPPACGSAGGQGYQLDRGGMP